jgi:hypothetical protein
MVDCSFGCAQPSDFAPSHRRYWTGSLVQISGSPHRVERSEWMAANQGTVGATDHKPSKRYAEAGEMTKLRKVFKPDFKRLFFGVNYF